MGEAVQLHLQGRHDSLPVGTSGARGLAHGRRARFGGIGHTEHLGDDVVQRDTRLGLDGADLGFKRVKQFVVVS